MPFPCPSSSEQACPFLEDQEAYPVLEGLGAYPFLEGLGASLGDLEVVVAFQKVEEAFPFPCLEAQEEEVVDPYLGGQAALVEEAS